MCYSTESSWISQNCFAMHIYLHNRFDLNSVGSKEKVTKAEKENAGQNEKNSSILALEMTTTSLAAMVTLNYSYFFTTAFLKGLDFIFRPFPCTLFNAPPCIIAYQPMINGRRLIHSVDSISVALSPIKQLL